MPLMIFKLMHFQIQVSQNAFISKSLSTMFCMLAENPSLSTTQPPPHAHPSHLPAPPSLQQPTPPPITPTPTTHPHPHPTPPSIQSLPHHPSPQLLTSHRPTPTPIPTPTRKVAKYNFAMVAFDCKYQFHTSHTLPFFASFHRLRYFHISEFATLKMYIKVMRYTFHSVGFR